MIMLKLGGSLITEKSQPKTPRPGVILRLAQEIAQAKNERPDIKLVVGHGSGSFGHPVAERYRTHLGASSEVDWLGFAEVWAAAQQLNRLVMDALIEAGLPVLAFPPSASTIMHEGTVRNINVEPIKRALDHGLMPVVHGDVAFDRVRGSSIISTEQVFGFLAGHLHPQRILLAGRDPGVFADYPTSDEIFPVITEDMLPDIPLLKAEAPDVTGGMGSKIRQALSLAQSYPDMEVRIFSAEEPGSLTSALLGGKPGTLISSKT